MNLPSILISVVVGVIVAIDVVYLCLRAKNKRGGCDGCDGCCGCGGKECNRRKKRSPRH